MGGVQEVSHGGVGLRQDRIGLVAGGKSAFVVGVAFEQVVLDAFGGEVEDLRAAGDVEGHAGLLGLIISSLPALHPLQATLSADAHPGFGASWAYSAEARLYS